MCFRICESARTDTNCIDIYWCRNISPNLYCAIWIVTKFWSFGKLARGTKIPLKIGPKLKILLKTRANSAKLSAFSDSVTPIYPKNDLKFRAF